MSVECPNGCDLQDGTLLLGYEIQGVYDGILIWQCGVCGHRWPRFADGPRHDKAVEIIGVSVIRRALDGDA